VAFMPPSNDWHFSLYDVRESSWLVPPSVVGITPLFNSQMCPYESQRIPPRELQLQNLCSKIVFLVSTHVQVLGHASCRVRARNLSSETDSAA
jgi:hypothetical protein